MTNKLISVLITLAAYSDSPLGFLLRGFMVRPMAFLNPELAAYVVWLVHF